MGDEQGNWLSLDLCYGCGTCFVLTYVLFFVAAESSCTRSFSAMVFQVAHFKMHMEGAWSEMALVLSHLQFWRMCIRKGCGCLGPVIRETKKHIYVLA